MLFVVPLRPEPGINVPVSWRTNDGMKETPVWRARGIDGIWYKIEHIYSRFQLDHTEPLMVAWILSFSPL